MEGRLSFIGNVIILRYFHNQDSLMEDLITNSSLLFDERTANSSPKTTVTRPVSSSPPLPPAPEGEPIPSIAYGSSHTKVASVPPPSPRDPPSDFAPPLPPRPKDSIHPSLRANPISPARDRADVPPLPVQITEEDNDPRSPDEALATVPPRDEQHMDAGSLINTTAEPPAPQSMNEESLQASTAEATSTSTSQPNPTSSETAPANS
jgi:hypothetical protein